MAIIGIDLGTTKSAMAILKSGRPEIIPNRSGGRTTPSVVGLSRNNEILVGQKPKINRTTLADGPIEEVKRLMGQDSTVNFGGKPRSPQEISSYILRSLKDDAKDYLSEEVTCAVITIPAYFNEPARRATREAGEMAGLVVGMVLDEPSAAALAYGLDKEQDQTLMVYDLGGGTFDVSIIECSGGHFEILAISGNPKLGGKDFDHKIIDYVLEKVKKDHGVDLSDNKRAMEKLIYHAELCKCDLSNQIKSSVIIEAVTPDLDIDIEISRETFEGMIRDMINSTLDPIKEALNRAELTMDDVDNVLLVGGSTRIPMVRTVVKEFSKKEPLKDINPDECVAMGAAIYATLLDEEVKKKHIKAKDLDNFIPVTASGHKMEPKVVPRTAYPLGIGIDEGGATLSIIIPANSFYPISVTQKDYATMVNDQRGIEIWVYEGENPIAPKNTPLGCVRLGLPAGLPAGTSVWITFTLNESRILEAMVEIPDHKDLTATVTLDASGSLSKDERDRILSEHRMRASGGPPLFALQKQIEDAEEILKHNRDQIPTEHLTRIEDIISSIKKDIEAKQIGPALEKKNELTQVIREIRQKLSS